MPKPSPILYTQEGYEELKQEYEALKAKRPEMVQESSRAAEQGDRSENAAYKVAKQKVRQTDSRLRYLSKIIDRAKVVTASQSEYVEIGSTVVVNNGKRDITFHLVGNHEADPQKGKLSYSSPVGQALQRKKVGDTTTVQVPRGEIVYRIVAIK